MRVVKSAKDVKNTLVTINICKKAASDTISK